MKFDVGTSPFNATVVMARRGVGQAIVALPVKKVKRAGKRAGAQWIHVVTLHYRRPIPRLHALIQLLRRHSAT
jgi:hypothetical protein